MKTFLLTCGGIVAFLALLFASVWLEARVRLGDVLLLVAAAVAALAVWVIAYQILTP